MTGKEEEVIGEVEKYNLDIIGITETKRKGQGEVELHNGHVMFYSGVEITERAREGVSCIIHRKNTKYIKQWSAINERILKIEMEIDKRINSTILVVYAPNEDDSSSNKEKFWDRMAEEVEDTEGRLLIIGDLNSRVGKRDDETAETIGKHGEDTRNKNGKILIEFCMVNNLIITNTFFAHKDIHKYTREVKSRDEKSIIDYVIINKKFQKEVKDTRVKRGAEIYSDHYLVISKVALQMSKERTGSDITKEIMTLEKIRTYKLNEPEIAKLFRERVENEMDNIFEDAENRNIDDLYIELESTLLKAAKDVCGTIRVRKNRKQTRWWSKEILKEVKIKKQRWKHYLGNKTTLNFEKYKLQRTKVKELVKQAKEKSWKEFGEKMEKDSLGNQKLFYKILKSLRGGKQNNIKRIKTEEGVIIAEESDIMKRWKEHFEKILNPEVAQEPEEAYEEVTYDQHSNIGKISNLEIEEAIRVLKRGKAAGHDGITSEMLKLLGTKGIEKLNLLFNMIYAERRIPTKWEVGILLPLFKKGDSGVCSNYRGITILSTVLKVYERILEKRLKNKIDCHLEESQSAFRKGRGVQDHIFTVRQLIEKDNRNNLYVAFLDLEKAFDSIPRQQIWTSLKKRGINLSLIDAIKSIYKRTRNYVRTGNQQSEEFITKEGLRQGGVLSPTLFNVLMDDVIKEVKEKVRKHSVGYRNMEHIQISECAFADDLVVYAKNEKDLQTNLDIWKTALQKRNLKINAEKTKVMLIGKENKELEIQLNGNRMEQVETFKYLGVKVHKDGRNDAEINGRIESALKMYYALGKTFIRKKEVSKKTKMTVYKTIFIPTLTYGSESWVLTKETKRKLQTVEMKYLRAVLGVTRRDKIRNDHIRTKLQVEPLEKYIERNQLRWFGHLTRMQNKQQAKKIWQTRASGRRPRGRPRKTWDKAVAEILRERGLNWQEATAMARNKQEWAKFVHN